MDMKSKSSIYSIKDCNNHIYKRYSMMKYKFNLPPSVKTALNILDGNGFSGYVVGGCVRDLMLGLEPHDYDITTSALPSDIKNIFSNYRIIETGIQHGTVTVIIGETPLEITTFRVDGEYKDNRHPANVEFVSDLKLDLMRRDFTINAMAYNDKDGIIDLFGGIEDIKNKVIRCVGNPDERFTEDALRMLRAIRFAARFNYTIDNRTLISLIEHKHLIKNVSVERINSEIIKTLDYRNNLDSMEIISHLIELLKPIIADMYLIDSDAIYYRLTKSSLVLKLRLAILFDSSSIDSILKQLRFSNDIINDTVSIRNNAHSIYNERLIWANHEKPMHKYYSRKLLHRSKYENVIYAIQFAKLLVDSQDKETLLAMDILRSCVIESYFMGDIYSISGLDINGNDLLEFGYKGKQIGETLNYLLDMVMKDEVENRREDLLKKIFKQET